MDRRARPGVPRATVRPGDVERRSTRCDRGPRRRSRSTSRSVDRRPRRASTPAAPTSCRQAGARSAAIEAAVGARRPAPRAGRRRVRGRDARDRDRPGRGRRARRRARLGLRAPTSVRRRATSTRTCASRSSRTTTVAVGGPDRTGHRADRPTPTACAVPSHRRVAAADRSARVGSGFRQELTSSGGDVDRGVGEVAGDDRREELPQPWRHRRARRSPSGRRPPTTGGPGTPAPRTPRGGSAAAGVAVAVGDVDVLVLVEVPTGERELGVLRPHARAHDRGA